MGRTSRTARSRLQRDPEAARLRNAGSGAIRWACQPPVTGSLGRSSAAGSNGSASKLGSDEHEHGAKKRLPLAWLLAALQVAFLDGDRRQDAASPYRRS
jgi:hypothetical protein